MARNHAAFTAATKESERHMLRILNAYRVVMEKTVRIITGKPVKCEWDPRFQGNCYTDGANIFYGQRRMTALYEDNVRKAHAFAAAFKGATYHEMCHVLYSPRGKMDIITWIMEPTGMITQRQQAYNMLEDQRIESLFTARYPVAGMYFRKMFAELVVTSAVGPSSEAYALAYGRTYLPAEFRAYLRGLFVAEHGESIAIEVERIIDEYNTIVYPADTARAKRLIQRFLELIFIDMKIPTLGDAHHNSQMRKSDAEGAPNPKAQREAGEAAEKRAEADAAGEGDDPGDAADADGDGSGSGDGDTDEDASNGDGSGDVDSGDEASDTPGGGYSASGGSGTPTFDEDGLMDAAREILRDVMDSDAFQSDVESVTTAVDKIVKGDRSPAGFDLDFVSKSAPGEDKSVIMKVREQLRRVSVDLEPEWNHRQHTGRLNVGRLLNRQPEDTDVFDQWDATGDDLGTAEVVIAVDVSGSMGGHMSLLSRSVWILKRAFDDMNYETTVLAFSDGHSIMFKPSEKAERTKYREFGSYGSTNPKSAIIEAYSLLSSSDAHNRAFVMLTDGGWSDGESDRRIKAMASIPATAICLHLGGEYGFGRHGFARDYKIQSPRDLVPAVTMLVEGMLRTARENLLA